MDKYCQFCPVAKAAEILCEKWVILVLRELMMGSTRFNDLRRGLPKISPTILSRRLKTLEEQGVIEKIQIQGTTYDYRLTQSGEELRPLILGFGEWGHRWAKNKINKEDMDAGFLLWDMRRRIKTEYFGNKRVVIHIEFTDQKKNDQYWWMIIDEGEIDLCFEDTGHEPDIVVITELKTMTDIWLGYLPVKTAINNQSLKMYGPAKHIRDITQWLGKSTFSDTQAVVSV